MSTADTDILDSYPQEAALVEDEEARRLRREQERQDFKWLMSNKQGRRFMWRLLGVAGVFRPSYSMPPDAMATMVCEGRRSIGLLLMSEINELCPTAYFEMVKEQSNGRGNHKRRGQAR